MDLASPLAVATPEQQEPSWLYQLRHAFPWSTDGSSPSESLFAGDLVQLCGKLFCLAAPKVLLAAASPLLRTALADTDHDQVVLLLPDEDEDTVRLCLHYLGSGLARCKDGERCRDLRRLLDSLQVPNAVYAASVAAPAVADVIDEIETKDNIVAIDVSPTAAYVEGSYVCKECQRSFSRETNLTQHMLHHRQELLKCPYCPKEFRRPGQRRVHEKLHTKPYKCNKCDAAFGRKSNLTGHLRLHVNDRPYICDICGKGFPISSSLITHKKQSHYAGKKPYVCESCGLDFVSRSHMIIHNRSHTGERPHTCEECGKGFSTKKNMLNHMKKHSMEKTFTCEHCGEKFLWRTSMVRHVLSEHTEGAPLFPCQECDRVFKCREGVNRHTISVHSAEKQFGCPTCPLRFSTSSGAAKHAKKKRCIGRRTQEEGDVN